MLGRGLIGFDRSRSVLNAVERFRDRDSSPGPLRLSSGRGRRNATAHSRKEGDTAMPRFVLSLLAALMLLGFGPAAAQNPFSGNRSFSGMGEAIQQALDDMNQAPEITSLTFVSRTRSASGATLDVRWSLANDNMQERPRSGGCLEWRTPPTGQIGESPNQGSQCFEDTALSRRFTTWGGLAGQYQVRVQQQYLVGGVTYTSRWSNWSSVDTY